MELNTSAVQRFDVGSPRRSFSNYCHVNPKEQESENLPADASKSLSEKGSQFSGRELSSEMIFQNAHSNSPYASSGTFGNLEVRCPLYDLRKRPSRLKQLNRRGRKCWRALKTFNERFGLQHFVLAFVLAAYAFLGALVFYLLEQPGEISFLQKETLRGVERRQKFLKSLQTVYKLNCTSPFMDLDMETIQNWNMSANCSLEFERQIENYERQLNVFEPYIKYRWDYWNAVFYACTIFTTIGYGHMACRTFWGQFSTVFYALFGIPLMLTFLNGLGNIMFRYARYVWNKIRRRCRRMYRRTVLQRQMTQENSLHNGVSRCVSRLSTVTVNAVDEPYENFPLILAIGFVFLYIFMCAAIFCLWETNWDYATSVYFFFISLTTIGLGDVVPDHPRFTILGFMFFIVGLALVSMCINVMQAKVEKRYKMYFDWDEIQTLIGDGSRPASLLIQAGGHGFSAAFVNAGGHRLSVVPEVVEDREVDMEHGASLGVFQVARMPQGSLSNSEEESEPLQTVPEEVVEPLSIEQNVALQKEKEIDDQENNNSEYKYPAAFFEEAAKENVLRRPQSLLISTPASGDECITGEKSNSLRTTPTGILHSPKLSKNVLHVSFSPDLGSDGD